MRKQAGTFKYKNKIGEHTEGGFLFKYQNLTLLFARCGKPESGTFTLANGTQFVINCNESNILIVGFGSIFGMKAHKDNEFILEAAAIELHEKNTEI